jgi:hypothetical protein
MGALPVRLLERLRRIEAKRSELLDRAGALAPGVLRGRPQPDKWSIRESIEHLVLAEEDVLIDLANLDRLAPRARRPKDRLLYFVVMFVLRYDIPVKAPSDAMLPKGDIPLTELRKRWEANHARLRAYVEEMDGSALRRAVFRHPVTGPLTPPQAIRMLEVHLDRHARQIRELERSMSSGPSPTQR